ncbi:hypothetical protein ACFTAO_04655 [Paenibacillus rhizoplanae]
MVLAKKGVIADFTRFFYTNRAEYVDNVVHRLTNAAWGKKILLDKARKNASPKSVKTALARCVKAKGAIAAPVAADALGYPALAVHR